MVMSNSIEKFRTALISLCQEALKGNVNLERFYTAWPSKLAQTGFVSELYDDLEDGITHFPGKLLSGKKDIDLWLSSNMAHKIYLDQRLLESNLCEQEMFSLRNKILDEDIKSREVIESLIKEQKTKM